MAGFVGGLQRHRAQHPLDGQRHRRQRGERTRPHRQQDAVLAARCAGVGCLAKQAGEVEDRDHLTADHRESEHRPGGAAADEGRRVADERLHACYRLDRQCVMPGATQAHQPDRRRGLRLGLQGAGPRRQGAGALGEHPGAEIAGVHQADSRAGCQSRRLRSSSRAAVMPSPQDRISPAGSAPAILAASAIERRPGSARPASFSSRPR